MLKIELVKEVGIQPEMIEVEEGTTLEELVNLYKEDLPYRVLAAKVNNRTAELTKKLEVDSKVVFLDLRDIAVSRIYQNSVSFIYMKAVYDVLGNVNVGIENSLHKGVYTEIKTKEPLTVEDVEKIEERMREIVKEDIPLIKLRLERDQAMRLFAEGNHEIKMKMLTRAPHVQSLPIYSCGGFMNFFYGKMVPSTGYIEHFEVRKYRNGVLVRFPDRANPNQVPLFRDDSKLYQAFGEAKRWGNLMGISYAEDLNEKIETGEYKEVIQVSEALHEKKIAYIADEIKKSNKRVILISGPSSAGKTSFSKKLIIQLIVAGENPIYIGMDDYFLDRHQTPLLPDGSPNFEDLEAIDVDLFEEQMNNLLGCKEVDLPAFDFIDGKKIYGHRIVKATRNQILVIEGIHSLNKDATNKIKDDYKYKIYISPFTQLNIDNHNRIPTTDARFLRRIVRDHQFRGYSADKTIEQWVKVRDGEDKNIFPFNDEADMLFNSAHIYELAVLKKYAEPMLAAIGPDNEAHSEAVRLLRFLAFFKTIKDDSYIPNNSIIREFIGGSILV